MVPNAWSSTKLPAVRTTKRSPRFWSKTSSGAVRESAHATMMANGCCAWAVSVRRAAVGLPLDTSLVANRRLPCLSLASAASAGTEAAGGSAARTQAATLKQAMVAKTVSLDVVFIGSFLFVQGGELIYLVSGLLSNNIELVPFNAEKTFERAHGALQ